MHRSRSAVLALLAAGTVGLATAGTALGHEERPIGPYSVTVGFIEEPAYVGSANGLYVKVVNGDSPVEGVAVTAQAEVTYESEVPRKLDLLPVFGEPGVYTSQFVPTAAGKYTFHLTGQIEDLPIDEVFTSGQPGTGSGQTSFDSVKDAGEAQYPFAVPPEFEIAQMAREAADETSQIPIALALGGAGALLGLVALALAAAAVRRSGDRGFEL